MEDDTEGVQSRPKKAVKSFICGRCMKRIDKGEYCQEKNNWHYHYPKCPNSDEPKGSSEEETKDKQKE